MGTLIESLEHWSRIQPDQCLYSYLEVDGTERDAYTYQAFNERTRHLAEFMTRIKGLEFGDRVLLVYPPGLEVIAAFVACARAGVIPVPVYPPTPMAFEAGLAKLALVARDCGAKIAFTTRGFYRSYQLLLAKRRIASLWLKGPDLPKVDWVTTDDVRGQASPGFADRFHPTLFLQYTSGSTSEPKGVIVSHDNVVKNGFSTLTHVPICVSWLPQYHDMGLIGYYLFPLIRGGTVYGFSPLNFLKRPALWLQTISKVRSTITSSPNFGFDYCLREDKLPDEEIKGLDLSSLQFMMNAAEPVRAETFSRFYERFEPYGLSRDAHVVAYGLAENTLCVSNLGRQIVTVNKQLLQQQRLHLESYQPLNNNQVRLVSCGKPLPGVEARIVDPESLVELPEKEIGEIWLTGPSKCMGYWNRPELTRDLFEARIAGDANPDRSYLRTGDLGFMFEGEIFVCGRRKDVIIIRGVNYFPQDIEAIVEAASPEIRKGGVAAFSVDAGGEALVVLAEVRNAASLPDPVAIAKAIRTQYYVETHTIAFVPRGGIARTTSGKNARILTRRRWLEGGIEVIASFVNPLAEDSGPDLTGLRERFQYIVTLYNLTGQEDYTFAELGIDSLTLVRLLADIQQLLEDHGAGALVKDVDVRLLQRLTVAEFFSLVDQFEKSSKEPILALRHVLRRIQEEHEDYERECMKSDAELAAPKLEAEGPARDGVKNVLLTGATGFFGPFLLASLLRKTPYSFYVLTRATDPVHGMDRIRNALRRSRVLTPEMEEILEARVHVVCGNLTRHNLGLPAERWKTLNEKVHAICHNGALVNYVLNYDALRPTNVDGTREILRFAFSGAPKQFHHVSSTFIYGWTATSVLHETDNNDAMANLDFGYAQSKWVSEQLVLAARNRGLDVRIYRPSLISASTGGVGSKDDIAVRLFAFMIRHGIGVTAKNQLSFSPADVVADNIATVFAEPSASGRTLHLTVDDYYNMEDVTRLMTRKYGYRFTYFDIPGFMAQLSQRSTQDDLVYPLTDFFVRSQDKLVAMQRKRYNNDGYREIRERCGGRPDPSLEETVAHIVTYMVREGIIPPAMERPGEQAQGS